jgi:hypothetical protein
MVEPRAWLIPALSVLLVATMAVPERLQAQELSFPNRVLKNTYMKARSDELPLAKSYKSVFSPTSIVCPGSEGTCTARIEVSSSWWAVFNPGINFGTRWRVVRFGAVLPIVASPGSIFIEADKSLGHPVASFSWVLWGLEPGTHTIGVQAETFTLGPIEPGDDDGAGAVVLRRTLTITVYKP